jgi:uncharacterized repeat protein (TIGR01451 family)
MLSSVTTVGAQKKMMLDKGVVKIKNAPTFQVAGSQATTAGDFSTAGEGDGMYIVRLSDRPIATYNGGIQGLAPTSAQANRQQRLDTNSQAARAYRTHLQERQQAVLDSAQRELGRSLAPRFRYLHAFNGFAVELKADEVKTLRRTDGVVDVQKERIERPVTDAGPEWIGAPSIWFDGPASTMGEGVVVAVLDTGINHDHPSFAAVGGDGYVHENPLGPGNYIPGSYCNPIPERALPNGIGFCNDKLIGAWSFVEEPVTPEDSDGHGSHTASTAAGNVTVAVIDAPTLEIDSAVSGVAPHANIIAYDVCVDDCPGSALLAAVEQVLIDAGNLPHGIAALNYSISGGGNPYNDPVELGFLAAVDAGVYVSASAGNAGPGASTVAHLGPWVSTTAASTHDRSYPKMLVDLSSDGNGKRGKPRNLYGRGARTGYGPAPIVHAGNYPTDNGSSNDTEPEQCLDPFPPGTFAGEIVICDRGTIARVDKGLHVLLGGAGGFILANMPANGESTNGDTHYLPAIHVGVSQADWLRGWVAGNANTMGTIGPFAYGRNARDGDIMASFSSRGPQRAFDVLKPDISGPGVDVLAAVNSPVAVGAVNGGPATEGEFDFLSGTSMSSPHNAGGGALMTGLNTAPNGMLGANGSFLTPQEIKSAIMLTGESRFMRKEDAATPADPFDMGAGRIDLSNAMKSGLVMNETTENFLLADPDLGGDPSTLNLASMMNSACVGTCMWTRTVTNTQPRPQRWNLSTRSSDGVVLRVGTDEAPIGPLLLSAESTTLMLAPGESREIRVYADTRRAAEGWHFGQVVLDPSKSKGPTLHMPVAVNAATASNPLVFTKTVDKDTAAPGDTLAYELTVTNGTLAGPITVTDVVPAGTAFVPASETEAVTAGVTTSAWAYNAGSNSLSWTGELDVSGMVIEPTILVPGFLPLGLFGIGPVPCPSNCDEGGYGISDLDIWFNGVHFTTGIWSVNGTLELGQASGVTSPWQNTPLPDPNPPNNLLAPWWSDIDLTIGGTWSLGALTDGVAVWDIFEWNEAPDWGVGTPNSFQIWLERGTSNITYTYGFLTGFWGATVGVENGDGSDGFTYFFNGEGTFPTSDADLGVYATAGGSATLGFEVTIDCSELTVNEAILENDGDDEIAIAVTSCDEKRK